MTFTGFFNGFGSTGVGQGQYFMCSERKQGLLATLAVGRLRTVTKEWFLHVKRVVALDDH
jgi:hypothetical protein